jgi:hypothetical protein
VQANAQFAVTDDGILVLPHIADLELHEPE